jgi:hypothetical protein
MAKYQYIGQKYQQGDSNDELITFCATADDIKLWGGVPSKNERFHGGFQRALSNRYKKIIEFFNNDQVSPGSIVVAFREGIISDSPLALPSTWPSTSLSYKPEFVQLEFEWNDALDDADLTTLISEVSQLLEERLKASTDEVEFDEDQEDQEDEEEVDVDENEVVDEEQSDELDVGHSKLQLFHDFINNKEKLDAWLQSEGEKIDLIKSKIKMTDKEKDYVAFSSEEKLKATLLSLLRPAMIVDGQHRISGASESDKDDIVFTVSAIKDADWVEQVFQFVVLNKMAKPISKDFLTELLNTSLTNSEIDDIDLRLERIGIKNSDRIIQKYINHDTNSPFYGMIAEAGEVYGVDKKGKLSQQGMLRLAKRWRQVSKNTPEIKMFISFLEVRNVTEARSKWNDYNVWTPVFHAFWSELKNKYEHDGVWIKEDKFHLLYIVTLLALQELFIESKAAGDSKFTNLEDFKTQVKEFFDLVPSGFFMNWAATGLQSGDGPMHIKEAVKSLRGGKQLATVKKDSELF